MKCPHSHFELIIARLSAFRKIEKIAEERGEEATSNKCEEMVAKVGGLNATKQQVADFHGIPLEMLINSPNYEKLTDEFNFKRCNDLINEIQKEFLLSNAEAWALIMGDSL